VRSYQTRGDFLPRRVDPRGRSGLAAGRAGGRARCWRWLAAALLGLNMPAQERSSAQTADLQPLLPETIATHDIALRGKYLRQWREADGSWTLLYNGDFSLEFGRRRFSADNAVVWVSVRADPQGRKYSELTLYLSENVRLREISGTEITDTVLLVSNLRTFGRVETVQQEVSPENLEQSDFYQRAILDRGNIESGRAVREEPGRVAPGRIESTTRPPRAIRYSIGGIEPARTPDGDPVFVLRDGVVLLQEGDAHSPALEIRADRAVAFSDPGATRDWLRALEGPAADGAAPPATQPGAPSAAPPDDGAAASGRGAEVPADGALGLQSALENRLQAVYLEGDVRLSLGERFVRADRLYYDFSRDRALILDAVMRAELTGREVPLDVRAAEIRQLSAREFSARDARVSTSEFHTPHYHVGVERIVLQDVTTRDEAGRPTGAVSGVYEMENVSLKVEDFPIAWWPYSQGNFSTSETPVRRVKTGYSGDFGVEFESAWYFFHLIGVQPPPGYDATFKLDYFSERGPATGVDLDYQREDYYGLLRTYYINDAGEDNLGPLRDNTPDNANRGRILWRHRHFLQNDWQFTYEMSYVSDPGFLEEYERSEFFEGKEQETLVHLKRVRDTEAMSLLLNWRTLDFTTQTEHLPDFVYRRIGDTFLDPVVTYTEARFGMVRYRPDERRFFDDRRFDNTSQTDTTVRSDVRQEFELPLKAGPVNIVPFATLRGSHWDGEALPEGTNWRGLGVYGVRGGLTLSRVYDGVDMPLLDIRRIRHVVKPEYAAWWGHANTRSELLTPFDYGIETIDSFYGAMLALRQVWQTKRGPIDSERTVDLLTFDLEAGFFGNVEEGRGDESVGYALPFRPEESRPRNYIGGDVNYRLSDTTSVLYDFNIDTNDWEYDRHNVALAIERSPRVAYVVGWRSAGDIDMNLVGGGFNYRLNLKHTIAARAYWDIDRNEVGEISLAYVRKLPRWYVALSVEFDEVFDDTTVSLSIWPEGIPEWTLGSRRFTGLGTSTGIRP